MAGKVIVQSTGAVLAGRRGYDLELIGVEQAGQHPDLRFRVVR